MTKRFLRRVYDLETQAETDAYYSAWAATYDAEVTDAGYRSPERCADALARFASLDSPVLDIGCGTGISGAALGGAGFTNVSGTDVNAEMLDLARRSGVYQDLWLTDPARPFPFEPGAYLAVAAVGVIGVGAAPATLLGAAMAALPPGGHLVVSLNEHALETPEFPAAIDDVLASGIATQLWRERGPHFEQLGSTSDVIVLRRR